MAQSCLCNYKIMINRNLRKLSVLGYSLRTVRPSLLITRVQVFSDSKRTTLEKMTRDSKSLQSIIPDIQRPHEADGGVYSVERVMAKEEVSESLKQRLEDLRKRHELLRVELSKKVNIPFVLCGVNRKTYHESYGYLPERVMSYYRIHPTTITDYLLKIYKASLYAMIDRNTPFMEEYWEQGFKERALQSLQETKAKGFTVKLTEEKNYLEETKESCRIVDAVMVRGLSVRRSENEHPSQYHKFAEDKDFGLVTYTPKYLTEDNEKFIDPETNKTVFKGYEKMLLRVLLLVKTPLRLTIPELPVPQDLNTYEHLVVMENEMIAPPYLESSYKLETLVEWLGKYRFGPWFIVDIDNFMKGNSPMRLHQPEEELQEIFRNTVIDRSYYCNIRNL